MSLKPVIERLKQIQSAELETFFQDRERREPWHSDEWEDRREEHLAGECAWCGQQEALQIHHDAPRHKFSPNWQAMWVRAQHRAFQESTVFDGGRHTGSRTVCPACESGSYYERTTMTPTYRCRSCEHEFDTPRELVGIDHADEDGYIPKEVRTDAYYYDLLAWLTTASDSVDTEAITPVRDEFTESCERRWEDYLSMEDTITICRGCHFAYHEHNKRPCEQCSDCYHPYRSEVEAYFCWECFAEQKGIKRCPNCDNGWYNPEYTNQCSDCR